MKLYQIALLLFFISYVYIDTDCLLIANPRKNQIEMKNFLKQIKIIRINIAVILK